MKHVVHVMGMPSSKYGGIERFNVVLSQALWEKGFKSVFVYETYPESPQFVEDLHKSQAEVFVSNSRNHPLRFCMDFLRLIKKYHPDIVHAHFTKARFYAIPIAKANGVEKLFFTIHSRMDTKAQIKPLTRWWYQWANKKAKVIAVSEDISAMYNTNWPDAQVKRIYLGVTRMPCDRKKSRRFLEIPEHQMMLLTVANFNLIKGLDVLVKAVAQLKNQNKWCDEACLYIVGQPEQDKKELGEMIDSFGIGDEVKMVGISNEVSDYMASADLYLQPSRSEGLPLALMEAASFSLPLIGSRVGGIPEIIMEGCNGFVVEPENESQLADSITKMMFDFELREKCGANSLKVYQELFSVERGVKETLSYYGI